MDPTPPVAVHCGAVVLAAGASRRMGRPKLLLPWENSTVLGTIVERLRAAGVAPVVVVIAPGHEALERECERLGIPSAQRVVNPQPEAGMLSSVQAGLRWAGWTPATQHIAITLGDQPGISAATLLALCAAARRDPESIWRPAHRGSNGHPVLLPRAAATAIAHAVAPDLREALGRCGHSLRTCACDDAGVAWDLDTPEDYARAKEGIYA